VDLLLRCLAAIGDADAALSVDRGKRGLCNGVILVPIAAVKSPNARRTRVLPAWISRRSEPAEPERLCELLHVATPDLPGRSQPPAHLASDQPLARLRGPRRVKSEHGALEDAVGVCDLLQW